MLRKASAVATLVLVALLGTAPSASAADTLRATANTTYELLPSAAQIRVTIDLKVGNTTRDTVSRSTCTGWYWDSYYEMYLPYDYNCSTTTSWYVDSWQLEIERSARNIKATSPRGKVSVSTDSSGTGEYKALKLTFPKTFNHQTTNVRVTYTLAGGKPRSGASTRAGRSYASFCSSGNGENGGTVRIVLPKGFTAETTGDKVATTTAGGKTILSSGNLKEPLKYLVCVDAANPSAYSTETITAANGRTVEIQSWPEDPDWLRQVTDEVKRSLPALESLVGVPLPGTDKVVVREVTVNALGGDYVGTFDRKESIARVSEKFEAVTVAHELSHAWFNTNYLSERWLAEGYASYAEVTAGEDDYEPCERPEVYAGAAEPPSLANWKVLGARATDDDRAAVAYQYDAACWIITDVIDAIGENRMTDVLRAAWANEIAYTGAGPAETMGSGATDWRTWLDLVDERGFVPAGRDDLDFTQRLLADYGIAKSASELDQRSAARSQYHELATQAGEWSLPIAIRSPLANWQFAQATSAMDAANAILRDLDDVSTAAPDARVVDSKLHGMFEGAKDMSDLRAVADLVEQELAAAQHVAKAHEAADRDRGPIEELGLAGTDLSSLSRADEALAAIDPAGAEAAAVELEAALAGAANAGTTRASVLMIVLLLAAAGVVLIVRRRRSRVVAGMSVAAVADPMWIASQRPAAPEASTLSQPDATGSGDLAADEVTREAVVGLTPEPTDADDSLG
jgi:hypothetical protein